MTEQTPSQGAEPQSPQSGSPSEQPPQGKLPPPGHTANLPATQSKSKSRERNKLVKSSKRGSRQVRHLAQAIILEESGTSAMVRYALYVTCACITAVLIWAGLTNIEEMAATQGTVLPSSSIQDLQHLEGGIVGEILAHDGDLVEAGQPLIRLSPAQAQSDLEQTRARQAGLLLKAERLRAFVENRDPNFSVAGPGWDALVADQTQIWHAQVGARNSGRSIADAQVNQRTSEIQLYERQLKSTADQASFLHEEEGMRSELLAKGLVSRVVYLDTKRELARVEGERSRILGEVVTSQRALAEAKTRYLDVDAQLNQKATDELGAATSELAQVEESLSRLEDRVTRLDILSSTRGLVQGLTVKTIGAVIQPGQIVGQIVPVSEDMDVECRILTRDIGHIAVGQAVNVKITAYDYSKFGAIDGTLTNISANTFMDEDGKPYYKGTVRLAHNYAGSNPGRNRILPGMTVSAEIRTGSKTLLEYLLKPIYVALSSSFHER